MSLLDETPKAKNKNKPQKPTKTQLAFRDYERVSWYLATQGVFDFEVDDMAREYLWAFDGEDMSAEIKLCIANRLQPESDGPSYTVPKGDHIDGLAIRTAKRYDRDVKVKKTEKHAVDSLLPTKKGKKS